MHDDRGWHVLGLDQDYGDGVGSGDLASGQDGYLAHGTQLQYSWDLRPVGSCSSQRATWVLRALASLPQVPGFRPKTATLVPSGNWLHSQAALFGSMWTHPWLPGSE